MEALSVILRKLGRLCSSIGAVSIFFIMILASADVISSLAFNYPIPGTKEIVRTTMVVIVFSFLLDAQISKRHVVVDIFFQRFPKKIKLVLDMFSLVLGLIIFGIISFYSIPMAYNSWVISECTSGALGFPIYPSRTFIAITTCLICIQFIIDFTFDFKKLIQAE